MANPVIGKPSPEGEQHSNREPVANLFDLILKLGVLGFLAYWSIVLVRPFLFIGLWSLILTVTLYPAFNWLSRLLGGRLKLAAAIITATALLVFTGPVIWLGMSMVDGLDMLAERVRSGALAIPPPSDEIKSWPLIGEQLYGFWNLAATDSKRALEEARPHLEPLGGMLRNMAKGAATGVPSFWISLIIAGFLFAPAPKILDAIRRLSQRLLPARGHELINLAGATIRNVAQGVIGVALLQALLSGAGFVAAGVPASGLLALAVFIFAILQLPGAVLVPVIIWGWTALQTTAALTFTAYLTLVALINNVLSPALMAHGLKTPTLVIFVGVIGGAIAHGIIGLFLGPIVLAVTWELIVAWIKDEERSVSNSPQ